jgi:hypothetical protein
MFTSGLPGGSESQPRPRLLNYPEQFIHLAAADESRVGLSDRLDVRFNFGQFVFFHLFASYKAQTAVTAASRLLHSSPEE